MGTSLIAADSNLKRIRCNLYSTGGKPEKIRISLDFTGKPERLKLVKSTNPIKKVSNGYIKDFIIVTQTEKPLYLIENINIQYSNTKAILIINVEYNAIHISIKEKFELQTSKFYYLDNNKVAYIDLKVVKRDIILSQIELPVKKEIGSKPLDIIKKDKAQNAKSIRPTYYRKKDVKNDVSLNVVTIRKPTNTKVENNELTGIKCEYFVHWWSEPRFLLDFCFSVFAKKLIINKSTVKLIDIPPDYQVKYVISPDDENASKLFNGIDVDYLHCNSRILLKQHKNKCYILVKDDYTFKPQAFVYDADRKLTSIRILH
ncbi:MAG: hypothetical protein P9X24_16945 [Candidatus Hatepunaea meridiana]|nr:hypothetical protein [Candidatus Hatepunaea meridiana]